MQNHLTGRTLRNLTTHWKGWVIGVIRGPHSSQVHVTPLTSQPPPLLKPSGLDVITRNAIVPKELCLKDPQLLEGEDPSLILRPSRAKV
jgi:hypothetical protein